MRKDELAAAAPIPAAAPVPATIPVICDRCRAAGHAGDPVFSAIPDILDFTPVPRRARVGNWTAEHQRAFIAALAITGSPRKAAAALGRHAFGAEQLRKAAGGKSFADAWDAAMDLARERELARIHANLAELSAADNAAHERAPALGRGWGPDGAPSDPHCDYDPDFHLDDYPEYWEARKSIRLRLTSCRRLLLAKFAGDPQKEWAWEVLVGPVDWEKAKRLEPQDDEPFQDPKDPDANIPNLRQPDMVLAADHGLLGDVLGGHDAMGKLREELANPPLPLAGEDRGKGLSQSEGAPAEDDAPAKRPSNPVRPERVEGPASTRKKRK